MGGILLLSASVTLASPCPNHPLVREGLGRCGQCGRGFCRDCLVWLGGSFTCAGCKPERLRDIRSGAVELDLASPWARFCAVFLDSMLFVIPAFTLYDAGFLYIFEHSPDPKIRWGLHLLGVHPQRGVWLPLLFTCLLTGGGFVYQVWMLSLRGQTLGKMALGIKVVTLRGGDIRFGQALLRVLSDTAMAWLYLSMFDALLIFTKSRRTIHDRLARTMVVKWKRAADTKSEVPEASVPG